MGLFDFIRNELIEVIDWVDQSTDTVIWKFQDKENNIKNGAQLTVRQSQCAVLMNEGEFGDIYEAGLHSLTSKNMPITTTLKSWKYGFESPFKVDVYFVNLKQFTNLKWGTSGPILLRDSEYGQVRLKSFGNYSIRVVDVKKFIKEFAGTNPYVKIDGISDTVQGIIASKLAESFAEIKITVLDLAANFTEVGDKIKPILQTELDAYGILLEKFFLESVSLPDEVEKMIDKKTELNILKNDLSDFNKMQGGIAIEKLAENESAGGIGGVVLTNLMNQNQQVDRNESEPTQAELMETLKQLAELKAQGIITEEEFNQKKKDILEKI